MPAAPAPPDELAPAPDGRVRRWRRTRRWLLIAGITLVTVAALLTAGGVALIRRFDGALGHADLLDPRARQGVPGAAVTGPLNFLLIGSDRRAGNPSANQRSDTIIIVHVPSTLDRAVLISVPRDLLVTIPPDPPSSFGGARTKINAAFQYGGGGAGGTRLLSHTLSALAGVRFDGAAVIEFSGLKRAVDLVGGVTMCVDKRTVSIHTRKVFEPGCRRMGSADALDYLRQRDFADGDFTRQRHQQQFLKAFLREALSAGVVANPIKLDAMLRAVGGALTVDTGGYSLTDLVFGLGNIRPESLAGIKVPTRGEMWGDQSVVVATGEAETLFAALRADGLEAWAQGHPRWVNAI